MTGRPVSMAADQFALGCATILLLFSAGQGDWHHGDNAGGCIGIAALDEFPGALGHGDAGARDVKDQVAAVADELGSGGSYSLFMLAVRVCQDRTKTGETLAGGDHLGPDVE